MGRKELYNRVYFRAVRRAMLENETVLKKFMQEVAVNYSDEKLEELDKLLLEIGDTDLFNILMGHIPAENFAERYNVCLLKEICKIIDQRS